MREVSFDMCEDGALVHSTLPTADAQLQSVVTEVQNIIGQVREQGRQVKEVGDKMRNLERNDNNERFGIELAGALSRIETV